MPFPCGQPWWADPYDRLRYDDGTLHGHVGPIGNYLALDFNRDGDDEDLVVASAAGTVVFAGWQDGYGNIVKVDHGGGWQTWYAHLRDWGPGNPQPPQGPVARGDELGQVGATGTARPHLHYEQRHDGAQVHITFGGDPVPYWIDNYEGQPRWAADRVSQAFGGSQPRGPWNTVSGNCPGEEFSDTGGTTHDGAVSATADAGVAGGFPDGTFRPGAPVTRGQMAAFLTRALRLPRAAAHTFVDVSGSVHEAAVAALAAAGITGGYPDGTFRPDVVVSRGQMAAFLQRALDLAPGAQTFADAASTVFADAVAAVAAAGIAGGFPDGTFRPGAAVTRGQMATFLVRALGWPAPT